MSKLDKLLFLLEVCSSSVYIVTECFFVLSLDSRDISQNEKLRVFM